MMRIEDIQDAKSFEEWLRETEQPREVCVALAHRAAMRVAPWLWKQLWPKNPFDISLVSVNRALLVSGIATKGSNPLLRDAAFNSLHPLKLNSLLMFVHDLAEVAAVQRADEARKIATRCIRTIVDQNFVGVARSITWPPVVEDCAQIVTDLDSPGALWTEESLMRDDEPVHPKDDWSEIRLSWVGELDRGWRFWIDWYDAALDGRQLDRDMLTEIATQPDTFWQGADDEVNARIAAIYAAHLRGDAPIMGRAPEGDVAEAVRRIGTRQIREALQEHYPDLRARAAHLVALVQQERAAHALVPRPNSDDALEEYEQKEEFLKTMEAGIVSFHDALPESAVDIPEAEATKLRDRLIELGRLVNATVRYLDEDRGTYGGLYKIGLISGVAGILSLIPGVNFLAGAALPAAVLGAQTVRLRVRRDD